MNRRTDNNRSIEQNSEPRNRTNESTSFYQNNSTEKDSYCRMNETTGNPNAKKKKES